MAGAALPLTRGASGLSVARAVETAAGPRETLPVAGPLEGTRGPFRPAGEPLPVARMAEPAPPAADPAPAPAPPPVVVAREADAPIPHDPAPAPAPVTAAAPVAGSPPPETEELVKKLFDPLLRRLKTELRLDRERRGALTDRPH